uniref:ZP domain-containing protein n=1 Tax=Steinernema glaseri TaxID=37863 RepID=A0A1I8AV72_9BILA
MKPNCALLICSLLFVVLAVANGAGSIPGRDGCSLRINEFDTGLFARTPPSQPFFVELAQENCKTENLLDVRRDLRRRGDNEL